MSWKNIYKDHLTGEEVERFATPDEMVEFEESEEEFESSGE